MGPRQGKTVHGALYCLRQSVYGAVDSPGGTVCSAMDGPIK